MKATQQFLTRRERALAVDRRLRDQSNRQVALILRQQQQIAQLEAEVYWQVTQGWRSDGR